MSSRYLKLRHMLSRVVAWTIVPLFLAGTVIMIWLQQKYGLADESPLEVAFLLVGFCAFAVVGSLLVARQPGNLVGWIMATIGLMISLFPAAETYTAYIMTTRGRPDFLAVFGVWVSAWYWYPLLALALIYLPLFFPDGRLPSSRWWPFAVIPGIGTVGLIVLGALSDPLTGQNVAYQVDNPIGIEGMPMVEEHPLFPIFGSLVLVIGLLGATAGIIFRFRRSHGIERQQLKWFLYAAMLLPLMAVAELVPVIGGFLLGLILVALPTAIGIAVLRYRLYDIDLIIRRTVVYALLTASLALFYTSSVVILQQVLRSFTGQAGNSPIAIVIATLGIAILFSPLRRRIQDFIDRRFYRSKYDAEQILANFAATTREEVDIERLASALLAVVENTVQPEQASLWLRPAADRRQQTADRTEI